MGECIISDYSPEYKTHSCSSALQKGADNFFVYLIFAKVFGILSRIVFAILYGDDFLFDLIKLTDRTMYFDMPSKIGVYKLSDSEVVLIDSGISAKTAARVFEILKAENLKIAFIINTHSHTDHAGGNRYLCEITGCKAYAAEVEDMLIGYPDVEATLVYGAYPCDDFRKKFMNTEASFTYNISEAPLPKGMEIMPLYGHTAHMIGVKTPDDVYFIADAVNSSSTFEKTKICYVYDIDTQLETLENLKKLDGKICVPSHAEPTRVISEVAEVNIQNLLEIREDILSELKRKPQSDEEITSNLCRKYNLKLDFTGLVMVSSAVKCHLVSLRHKGLIDGYVEDFVHYWRVG